MHHGNDGRVGGVALLTVEQMPVLLRVAMTVGLQPVRADPNGIVGTVNTQKVSGVLLCDGQEIVQRGAVALQKLGMIGRGERVKGRLVVVVQMVIPEPSHAVRCRIGSPEAGREFLVPRTARHRIDTGIPVGLQLLVGKLYTALGPKALPPRAVSGEKALAVLLVQDPRAFDGLMPIGGRIVIRADTDGPQDPLSAV